MQISFQNDFLQCRIEEFRDAHRNLRLAEWKTHFPWNNPSSKFYSIKKEFTPVLLNVFVVFLDDFLFSRTFFHHLPKDSLYNINSQLKKCSFILLPINIDFKSFKIDSNDIKLSKNQIEFLNVLKSLHCLKVKLLLISKYPLNDLICVLLMLRQHFDLFAIFDILISITRHNIEALMDHLLNDYNCKLTVITEDKNKSYFKTYYTNIKLIGLSSLNDVNINQMKKEIFSKDNELSFRN